MSVSPVRRVVPLFFLVVLATSLEACRAVAGIFKAGVWVGVVFAVIVVGVILAFIGRMRR